MIQRIRRSPARSLAVLATPLLTLGVMAGTAPAASASQPSAGYFHQTELTASDAAAGQAFGSSVAVSAQGTTAVVGEDNRNTGTGAVYVFTLHHGTWSQTAVLTAAGGTEFDDFGRSVAVSAAGSTVVVGANGRTKDTGAAYVFTRHRHTWSQTAELTATDAAAGDQFGFSVALSASGSTALVAAIGHHSETGAAYVFTLRHRGWSQTAELTASDAAPENDFGQSVALSAAGTTALVGDSVRDADSGAAYVFTLHRTWSQTAVLTGAAGDGFGFTVGLSATGTTALAAAPFAKSSTGAVYVFTLRHRTWSRTAELTAPDGASGDNFGQSAALSAVGTTVLVGAGSSGVAPPSGDTYIGAAYVSTLRHGAWSRPTKVAASDATRGDGFGDPVALSATGATALIAAPFRTTNAGYSAGAVFVLTKGRGA
jgi:hypothetical protein